MRNINYLKYVVRHKWFVFTAGRKVGCSMWRLLAHDASKFLPSEWRAYALTFYAPDGTGRYEETTEFDEAWLHHQHRNKHHWQYWLLREDSGKTKKMDMPEEYILEMVADWAGAGRAITGRWEVSEWYAKNAQTIEISGPTRNRVEGILCDFFGRKKPSIPVVEEL